MAQKSRLKKLVVLAVSNIRVGSDIFESACLLFQVGSFFLKSARMDYADFFTLLESTLPTSSRLVSNYPKLLTLLESTLLH